MKFAPSPLHIVLATVALALVAGGLGCNTRTSIGEATDAGDAAAGEGSISASGGTTGTGGTIGGSSTGGSIGTSGEGGTTGLGGHLGAAGGSTGATGGTTGALGGGPGGAAPASTGGVTGGGAGGRVACAPTSPPAQGGPGGASPQCWLIFYPASGFYGDNILADGCTQFTSGVDYEIAAQQTTNVSVQVTITSLSITGTRSGLGGAAGIPIAPLDPGWYYGSDGDWRAKTYDTVARQEFFQTRALSDNETEIQFDGTGSARVDIYDCDPSTPSRSKIISWSP